MRLCQADNLKKAPDSFQWAPEVGKTQKTTIANQMHASDFTGNRPSTDIKTKQAGSTVNEWHFSTVYLKILEMEDEKHAVVILSQLKFYLIVL